MPFEEFTKSRSTVDAPMVSISKSGIISINNVCYNKCFNEKQEYVTLFFDKEKNKIGIKPMKGPTGNSYKVRDSKNSNMMMISGRAFLNYFEIAHEETRAYECNWNEQEQLIEIQL